MVTSKGSSNIAAFWSIVLALLTVIAWYAASGLALSPVFTLDPLWPGLFVSLTVFTALNFVKSGPISPPGQASPQ
jgi:Na+/pantothenate symporter